MKKILLLLAALSAATFGASTGVHTTTGSNTIDVETKAFIVNSGLVITRTAGTEGDTIKDAIKKATLDHGTLMAGTAAQSQATRTVYIRKTNGQKFPDGTVLNIGLNAPNGNNLLNGETPIPHTLDAAITKATNNNGNYTGAAVSNNTLSITGDDNKTNAADFEVEKDAHYVEVGLTSTIASGVIDSQVAEGNYANTSTLAVRFSKIPTTANDDSYVELADYGTPGQPIATLR
ncbi:MAG: hypothetical protein ACRCUR_06875 [Cetobacterium sp.]